MCVNTLCDVFLYLEQQKSHISEDYFMAIWHNRLYLYSTAALIFGIWFSLKMAIKKVRFSVNSVILYQRKRRVC